MIIELKGFGKGVDDALRCIKNPRFYYNGQFDTLSADLKDWLVKNDIPIISARGIESGRAFISQPITFDDSALDQ
jgi:hypothetical protein